MPCLRQVLERLAELVVGVLGEVGRRRRSRSSPSIMNDADRLGMLTWSRITSIVEQLVEALAAHADVDERALRSLAAW